MADFVEAEGVPMVTAKGELSIEPTTIRLLTKAMRPLPENGTASPTSSFATGIATSISSRTRR